ncbi:MAG TPA: cysteine desulfurase family protein [Sphingomonas sp.]|uniref:cysteine desulfurase family protein n=1 Tax=Sphingomonas sp. TaxID=28214 RepID=UPI002C1FA226|nr:cysteine desulfurase family protein [Sphingomonas sp.]HMI20084.1 cysteine desulfurase family protein [Sphingomonas sp.]
MIYLDYQATTPLAPEARDAMLPWLDKFGNPHSPHRLGREAAAAIEVATAQVAATLGDANGHGRLIFTSGATEAANWALQGAIARTPRRKIVTIATEHACVLDTAEWLAQRGIELVVLPVLANGLVDLDVAAAAIDGQTALVAAMLVNNEIGVIQPINALARLAHDAGALFFCDAVQGFGRVDLPLDVCDLAAISAHKLHGPKGIGALWLRNGLDWPPLIHGGGQQQGLRSGTLSPMLCAGFGAAARLAEQRRDRDRQHIRELSDISDRLFEDWTINGDRFSRYVGNLNLRRAGVDANRLISDVREVAFSAGSACASGSGRPSHVLRAVGLSEVEARSSIRLGFGRYTTQEEIEQAASLINQAAARQLEWA